MGFLKFISRDKKHIISFIVIPIVAIFAVCFIFSKIYVENIPFGVVDMDNSSLSRTIVQQLKNHPGLKVNYYTDSESELEGAIREKRVNGGIVIPKDFNKEALQMKAPGVLLLIDGTNIVIGNNVLGYSSNVLGTISAGVQLNVLQGKNMLPYLAKQSITSFSFAERILYETQLSYMRYLVYTIMPFLVQMFFLTTFLVPTLIEEKKKFSNIKIRSKEGLKNIFILLNRVLMMISILTVSSFVGLCVVDKYYDVPMRGNVIEYAVLMFIFLINLTAMGFVFAAIMDNAIYFIQIYGMMNLVIMLSCGVPWPEYMMPGNFAAIVKNVWPLIHAALPLKYLNLKGVGWEVILPFIKDGLHYTSIWMPVGICLYSGAIFIKKYKSKKLLERESLKAIQMDEELLV